MRSRRTSSQLRKLKSFRAVPKELKTQAFFNCWTGKRPTSKARGEGLHCPLDQFDVSVTPGAPAMLLNSRIESDEAQRWRLEELTPARDTRRPWPSKTISRAWWLWIWFDCKRNLLDCGDSQLTVWRYTMKFRSTLAFAALVLSLFTSADHRSLNCKGCWQPSTEPIAVSEAFGVNVHFIDPDPAEIKMIADAGFRWVRTDFKMELTEAERGKYDFTRYEQLVTELGKHNLRALFILDYGNPLYTQGMSVRTPEAREAFARWAVAAAKAFSGRGIVWEVFNEP